MDRTGQSKKSQGGNISPICGEAPTVPIKSKICMVGRFPDMKTCEKFQVEIFRGYDFTWDRISLFPIDFCMGLTTVRRYCAACDLILTFNLLLNWHPHPPLWPSTLPHPEFQAIFQRLRIECFGDQRAHCAGLLQTVLCTRYSWIF